MSAACMMDGRPGLIERPYLPDQMIMSSKFVIEIDGIDPIFLNPEFPCPEYFEENLPGQHFDGCTNPSGMFFHGYDHDSLNRMFFL